MSMIRSLFRPGKGQTIARYTTAVASATMYPGDWVALNAADAPTAQGVSGVFGGQTLGSADYIECILNVTTALGCGSLCLGVLMGRSISANPSWTNVLGAVLADQDIAIIMSYGIHPNARQASGGVLGDYLIASATAGEMANDTTGNVGATGAGISKGVCLLATSTYQRVTAADEDGSVALVTCS